MKIVHQWQRRGVLSLITLLATLAFHSQPAHAYEEDTHFTLTYVTCRMVGYTDSEALLVASYDQGMDDSTGTVADYGVIPFPEAERLWHAIPEHGTVAEVLDRKKKLVAEAGAGTDTTLVLQHLGTFLHYQQDTWAHRHHPNSDPTNFTPYEVPVGHALAGHQPDRPPFDPVCALRSLEDTMAYARMFMVLTLKRKPNPLFDNYTPALGQVQDPWLDPNHSYYFNQLDFDSSNQAHSVMTALIRAQIAAYTGSIDPLYYGYPTADQAKYDAVRQQFQQVCDQYNLPITVPTTRTPVTNLTTAQLIKEGLG